MPRLLRGGLSDRGARCFVHEPGTFNVLLQQEKGEVLTYVNDHLGTPKELIDGAGRVAWSAAHSAFGAVVETYTDPARGRRVESPFRLLGQYADDETGLASTRYRVFDPGVGSWLSPDPLGLDRAWVGARPRRSPPRRPAARCAVARSSTCSPSPATR